MPLDVRRSADRFVTRRTGSTTRHSFSFGSHYDPGNVAFGPVVAVNDELLEPGAGFDEHPHAGLVIVTYVVRGSLAHQGISTQVVPAGSVAVLRCGSGLTHAEHNAGDDALRFVQTWLTSTSLEQSYEVVDVGELAEVATVDDAVVSAGRLAQGSTVVVRGHAFVVSGTVDAQGVAATEGDALRLAEPAVVRAVEDATLLVVSWPAEPVRSGGLPCDP